MARLEFRDGIFVNFVLQSEDKHNALFYHFCQREREREKKTIEKGRVERNSRVETAKSRREQRRAIVLK